MISVSLRIWRSPHVKLSAAALFLLLIFSQQLTSLFLFDGVFICSTDVLISPFRFCLKKDGQVYCSSVCEGECDIKIYMATIAVILALYMPVVLVAFALLAMLFTVYARETATLTFSMICQAASSLLIVAGIIVFLLFNWQYVSWEALTPWFYMCMGVQVELIITTVLIGILRRKI
uniref:Transmembrane protein n=1 Tax=Echeneis naucrates TaxID=173247 RepID=A0A665UW48_ECHNA